MENTRYGKYISDLEKSQRKMAEILENSGISSEEKVRTLHTYPYVNPRVIMLNLYPDADPNEQQDQHRCYVNKVFAFV